MEAPVLPPQPQLGLPSFWDIFKNTRSIILEHPKELLVFLLVLEAIRLAIGKAANFLMADMVPLLVRFSALAQGDDYRPALQALLSELNEPGGGTILGKYAAGFVLPWIFLPVVFLAVTRVSLGLWDNYKPSLQDIGYAFKNYKSSVYICLQIFLYLFLVFLIFNAVCLPVVIVPGLSGDTSTQGFLTLAALGATLYGLYAFFWPCFRRAAAIQVLPFFAFADGTIKIHGVHSIYKDLKNFPVHLNHAIGVMLLIFCLPTLVIGLTLSRVVPAGLTSEIAGFAAQILLDVMLLWTQIPLAGFYRLCLYPAPEDASGHPAVQERRS
ncbi:MAG: hypothetical protein LBK52_05325 [Deltaproteobacteria bacterium]|jgi:hypothetical protein|nr:hypothetical protein [Deltaproteobacteria bacterium]